MTHAVSRALVGSLAPRPGERILDLACGAGDPALTLHEHVTPTGRVVALDPIQALAEGTRRAARDSGARRLAVVRAGAEQLPFARASFDAVSCRFGAMFFLPLATALAEVRRVLVDDGRVGLAVWGPRAANPYFTTLSGILDEVGVAVPPAEADQPTVFELADDGALAAALTDAGFRDVQVEPVPFEMVLEDTAPATFLDTQAAISGGLAKRVEGADPALLDRARALATRAGAAFTRGSDLAIPALALVGTGRRPRSLGTGPGPRAAPPARPRSGPGA